MKFRDSRGLRRPLPKPDTLSRTHRCEPSRARSVEIIGAEVDPEPAREIIRKQSACRVAPHDKVLPLAPCGSVLEAIRRRGDVVGDRDALRRAKSHRTRA
ncbi:MAG TPA: hypothetical protein DCQ98_06430 [Planctomycetaceae bacterium]|nr:hypothetical protein [Planctomycetaceae bacterium]